MERERRLRPIPLHLLVALASATSSVGKDFQLEIWNPESGEKRRIGEWRTENGVTPVELELPAEGSVFVVFREEGVRFCRRMPDLVATEAVLDGPWTLSFDADGGAPTGLLGPVKLVVRKAAE